MVDVGVGADDQPHVGDREPGLGQGQLEPLQPSLAADPGVEEDEALAGGDREGVAVRHPGPGKRAGAAARRPAGSGRCGASRAPLGIGGCSQTPGKAWLMLPRCPPASRCGLSRSPPIPGARATRSKSSPSASRRSWRERGHRVLIAAPSESRAEVRSSRAAISRARERPDSLFAEGEPRVLAVGGGVPLPRGPRPRPAPVPVDAGRALEALLGAVPLDIVHVHDPFGPSVSATALRHSFSLNVGTFHAAQERLFSTHIASAPGGDLLRPPRRAHRHLGGHRGAARALLPRQLRAGPPRCRLAPSQRR